MHIIHFEFVCLWTSCELKEGGCVRRPFTIYYTVLLKFWQLKTGHTSLVSQVELVSSSPD